MRVSVDKDVLAELLMESQCPPGKHLSMSCDGCETCWRQALDMREIEEPTST